MWFSSHNWKLTTGRLHKQLILKKNIYSGIPSSINYNISCEFDRARACELQLTTVLLDGCWQLHSHDMDADSTLCKAHLSMLIADSVLWLEHSNALPLASFYAVTEGQSLWCSQSGVIHEESALVLVLVLVLHYFCYLTVSPQLLDIKSGLKAGS